MKSVKHFNQTGLTLALSLLVSSCTLPPNEQAETSNTQEEKDSFVPYTWVSDTTMHKIILRMTEEEDGQLETWSITANPEKEERDVDYLIKVGMLTETDDGFNIASESELDHLPGDPDITPGMLSSAMESILTHNDVRWCGEPERGRDFRDTYLNRYNKYDEQPYDTQEEFLASIEDYVDCGTG